MNFIKIFLLIFLRISNNKINVSPVDTVPPCGKFVPITLPSHPGSSLTQKSFLETKLH